MGNSLLGNEEGAAALEVCINLDDVSGIVWCGEVWHAWCGVVHCAVVYCARSTTLQQFPKTSITIIDEVSQVTLGMAKLRCLEACSIALTGADCGAKLQRPGPFC